MRTRLADVSAVRRIPKKHARKSQTKSQRDPISDRVEQRQATEQQFRAHQATSSRTFGFTDTEEVTGSIPVPPTKFYLVSTLAWPSANTSRLTPAVYFLNGRGHQFNPD